MQREYPRKWSTQHQNHKNTERFSQECIMVHGKANYETTPFHIIIDERTSDCPKLQSLALQTPKNQKKHLSVQAAIRKH